MKFPRRCFLACVAAVTLAVAGHAQVPVWAKVTPADIVAAGINVQITGSDFGNGTFVLAAYFGGSTAVPTLTPAAYSSPDGITWTRRTLPAITGRTGDVHFLNGKFFLGVDADSGSKGSILSSSDGITWTASAHSVALYSPYEYAFGNGVYLAIASPVTGQATQVISSTDGVTWTPRTVVASASGDSVAFFNGKFFCTVSAAGSVSLYTSADGVNWARVTSAPTNLSTGSLAVSPTTLLLPAGTYANGLQSLTTDGVTFTTASPGLPLVSGSIRYSNGAFVSPSLSTSTSFVSTLARASFDGRTWSTIATTAPSGNDGQDVREIVYGNGRYVFIAEFEIFSGTTTVSPGGTGSGGGTTSGTIPTTVGELSAAALAGKSLNFTITGGNSPFESTGDFTLQLDTPSVGRYTIAISTGSVAVHSDTYTYTAKSDGAQLVLNNYLSGQTAVNLSLFFAGSPTALGTVGAGKSYYEMNTTGANKHGTFNISGAGSTTAAPTISAQPAASQNVAVGGSVTFTFTVTGTGITYQWFFNGVAITGAINFSYTIGNVTAANSGTYTVTATNAGGAVTSNAAVLTVAAASNTARLSNVSIRAGAGSDSQTLIVGVTVGGAGTSGTKTLLVRGTGPALTPFGVTGVLADPVMNVYNGTTVIASNDDWNSDAQVTALGIATGAFALTPGAKDAALVGTVPSGGYTVQLTGKAGGTGVALVEVYDATSSFTTATPRLTNVSARTQVGTGGNILITGFVVAGNGTRKVLIRATGPALIPFGVTGTLADPKLELYNGASVKLDENDNWNSSTTADQTAAGAFALTAGSKDAVLVATLAPGSYTAQVSGVGGTTGVALVEIYELP